MKVKINNREYNISIFDYFYAKKADKFLQQALDMIDEYNLTSVIKPVPEIRTEPYIYVGIRYKKINTKPYESFNYIGINNKSGYYSINTYKYSFDKDKFYSKVIQPNLSTQ